MVKPIKTKNKQRWRRTNHVRSKMSYDAERPRLSIFRSNKNIYCQIIDDGAGKTLASASTREKAIQVEYGGNCDAAKAVGKAIAERASSAGIKKVKFDRGPYKYHGRIAGFADAAREGGLEF
ncbi:50S ribosomal protein L18 [Pirellulaceae bacterium]|nr:50S ribosomal protein L18 [Pirellulaceae bacterium]MDB4794112.1 50S ribosomal protein L18 [Pirellulaceae bacterium]